MPIEKATIKNFTVFEDITFNFAKGVNVFIGENGTGKTHLMKLLYAACESKHTTAQRPITGTGRYEPYEHLSLLYELYANYIGLPPHDSSLIKHGTDDCQFKICVVINGINYEFGIRFTETTFEFITPLVALPSDTIMHQTVFIPSTEMLSHSKGFLNLHNQFFLPFDKIQTDIIIKAGIPERRELPETAKSILNKIYNVIDGTVVFEDDQYLIKKSNGRHIPFSTEAEGNKKFALVQRLIMNGSICDDTILFWDEPEANINPKLIPELVDILFDLEQMGVQIFIATHDYILAKYFEVKRRKNSSMLFHSLYFHDKSTACESNENFRDLKENPITSAFDILLDEVFEKRMGD